VLRTKTLALASFARFGRKVKGQCKHCPFVATLLVHLPSPYLAQLNREPIRASRARPDTIAPSLCFFHKKEQVCPTGTRGRTVREIPLRQPDPLIDAHAFVLVHVRVMRPASLGR
jgi:hypothetical protein